MIPEEAVGKPCILVAEDEKLAICQFGIIVARVEYLNQGKNKDSKKSITAANFKHIYWLLLNHAYSPNFWERIDPAIAARIMSGKSGTEMIVTLFREIQNRPVSRDIVQAIAQQKDYMKRLRKNGGARDTLARDGIALLSATNDSSLIAQLGLNRIGPNEFISFKAETPEHIELLRKTQNIE